MANPQVWVVRAGVSNQIASVVEGASVVAIGWGVMGDLSGLSTRDDFRNLYRSKYPEDSEVKVGIGAGQVFRFVKEIQTGDTILTPVVVSREVLIGEIVGNYVFDPQIISEHYPNIRKVKWRKKVSRDDLSSQFRNTLGGLLTVFRADGFLEEVKALLIGKEPPSPEGEVPEVDFAADVQAKADEMISDLLYKIDAYEFQDLVACVLRAMGFKTKVSAPGPDGGVDIRVFPDAFGFQEPRIRVQVKHRKGQATQQEVQQFAGATSSSGENYKGLFVSTGGFTTPAIREVEKHPNITLIDRDSFVNLLLEHYNNLEPQYQAMVPLRRVYIPVPPAI